MNSRASKKVATYQAISPTFFLTQPFKELVGQGWKKCPKCLCLAFGLVAEVLILHPFWKSYLPPLPQWVWYLEPVFNFIIPFAGFYVWGFYQAGTRCRLIRRLDWLLRRASLQNIDGGRPRYISDLPLDGQSRKLTLAKNGISFNEVVKAKPALEAGLRVYIDDIGDIVNKGQVQLVYGHSPMPQSVGFELSSSEDKGSIQIGQGRSGVVTTGFDEVPHLLVAGQTGGGKSTFLRQLLTNLMTQQDNFRYILVDLKEGLEFQTFEGVPGVDIFSTGAKALEGLEHADKLLTTRLQNLKKQKAKDITAAKNIQGPERVVIVMDEVAELFNAGSTVTAAQAVRSKAIVSRIARLGRAAGLHLVLATQRPDRRVIDTQIKANLPGKICFQMADLASSMVVLGNGRAKDLPAVPGRAVWQHGLQMTEIQTPHLEETAARDLLRAKVEAVGPIKEPDVQKQIPLVQREG